MEWQLRAEAEAVGLKERSPNGLNLTWTEAFFELGG
jgi:hypothetical protein